NDFTTLLLDLGECPKGLTIDRWPDPNGHYSCGKCPECLANGWKFNVRWATRLEQARNTSQNKHFTVSGITGCFGELCEHFQIHQATVSWRLNHGWTVEAAFTTPT